MKKSNAILLTPLFIIAAASCGQGQDEEWISGGDNDTLVAGGHYRYYGGSWYPVYNNRIAPTLYSGSSIDQIGTPGYAPTRTGGGSGGSDGVRSGGFGSSAEGGGVGGGE